MDKDTRVYLTEHYPGANKRRGAVAFVIGPSDLAPNYEGPRDLVDVRFPNGQTWSVREAHLTTNRDLPS